MIGNILFSSLFIAFGFATVIPIRNRAWRGVLVSLSLAPCAVLLGTCYLALSSGKDPRYVLGWIMASYAIGYIMGAILPKDHLTASVQKD